MKKFLFTVLFCLCFCLPVMAKDDAAKAQAPITTAEVVHELENFMDRLVDPLSIRFVSVTLDLAQGAPESDLIGGDGGAGLSLREIIDRLCECKEQKASELIEILKVTLIPHAGEPEIVTFRFMYVDKKLLKPEKKK